MDKDNKSRTLNLSNPFLKKTKVGEDKGIGVLIRI